MTTSSQADTAFQRAFWEKCAKDKRTPEQVAMLLDTIAEKFGEDIAASLLPESEKTAGIIDKGIGVGKNFIAGLTKGKPAMTGAGMGVPGYRAGDYTRQTGEAINNALFTPTALRRHTMLGKGALGGYVGATGAEVNSDSNLDNIAGGIAGAFLGGRGHRMGKQVQLATNRAAVGNLSGALGDVALADSEYRPNISLQQAGTGLGLLSNIPKQINTAARKYRPASTHVYPKPAPTGSRTAPTGSPHAAEMADAVFSGKYASDMEKAAFLSAAKSFLGAASKGIGAAASGTSRMASQGATAAKNFTSGVNSSRFMGPKTPTMGPQTQSFSAGQRFGQGAQEYGQAASNMGNQAYNTAKPMIDKVAPYASGAGRAAGGAFAGGSATEVNHDSWMDNIAGAAGGALLGARMPNMSRGMQAATGGAIRNTAVGAGIDNTASLAGMDTGGRFAQMGALGGFASPAMRAMNVPGASAANSFMNQASKTQTGIGINPAAAYRGMFGQGANAATRVGAMSSAPGMAAAGLGAVGASYAGGKAMDAISNHIAEKAPAMLDGALKQNGVEGGMAQVGELVQQAGGLANAGGMLSQFGNLPDQLFNAMLPPQQAAQMAGMPMMAKWALLLGGGAAIGGLLSGGNSGGMLAGGLGAAALPMMLGGFQGLQGQMGQQQQMAQGGQMSPSEQQVQSQVNQAPGQGYNPIGDMKDYTNNILSSVSARGVQGDNPLDRMKNYSRNMLDAVIHPPA